MKRQTSMLVTGKQHYQLAMSGDSGVTVRDVPAAPDASPEQIARAVHDLLATDGHQGQSIQLALASEQCLSASISLDGLPRSNRRSAMVYRLEEKFPLAAEDLAADFVMDGPNALGIVTLAAPVKALIHALETEGIAVTTISPVAMLAVQHRLAQMESAPACDVLLWGDAGQVEIVVLHEGKPAAWYVVPEELNPIQLHLGFHASRADTPLHVHAIGIAESLAQSIGSLENVQFTALENQPLLETAALCAQSVEQGKTAPWFDLRRDALAVDDPYRPFRRPLTAAIAAMALLMVTLSAILLFRSWQYEQIAQSEQDEQLAIFRQALPGQVAPASVISRLASEERKLRGLAGDSTDLPQQQSALAVLCEALGRLPTNLRFRILEMRFGQQQLYLEGEAQSHGDADAIAVALRKFQGFDIEAPKTEQLADKGIAFTLVGTSATEAREAAQ